VGILISCQAKFLRELFAPLFCYNKKAGFQDVKVRYMKWTLAGISLKPVP
jgi:hypothetical protein